MKQNNKIETMMTDDKCVQQIQNIFEQLKRSTNSIASTIVELPYFQIFEPKYRQESAKQVIALQWLIFALKAISEVRDSGNFIDHNENPIDNFSFFNSTSPIGAGFLAGYNRLTGTIYPSDLEVLHAMPKYIDYIAGRVFETKSVFFDALLTGETNPQLMLCGELFDQQIFIENPDWFHSNKSLYASIQARQIMTAANTYRREQGLLKEYKSPSLKEMLWSGSVFRDRALPTKGVQVITDKDINHTLEKVREDIIMGSLSDCKAKGKIATELSHYANLMFPLKLVAASSDAVEKLNQLNQTFPNFIEVTEFIKERVSYLAARNMAFHIPNILLVGEPGVGKSAYVSKLSSILGVASSMIPMPSISTAAEFSGLSTVWSTAQQGIIATKLSESDSANPIFLLDELDKTVDSGGNSVSPKFSLLSITEKKTASRFLNPFYNMQMDLSHINWMATANNTGDIERALLSRFKTFHIPVPNKKEFTGIANSIYFDVLSDEQLEDKFASTLCTSVIEKLHALNMRDVREKLKTCVMRAYTNNLSINGKLHVSPKHIEDKKTMRSIL